MVAKRKGDPEKRREYMRNYYRNYLVGNPEAKKKHLARVRANDEKYKAAVREVIAAFKAAGCKLCGERESCCLSAHHLDPAEKDFEIGIAISKRIGIKRVTAELAKCVCLCHNCHAKVHAGLVSM